MEFKKNKNDISSRLQKNPLVNLHELFVTYFTVRKKCKHKFFTNKNISRYTLSKVTSIFVEISYLDCENQTFIHCAYTWTDFSTPQNTSGLEAYGAKYISKKSFLLHCDQFKRYLALIVKMT